MRYSDEELFELPTETLNEIKNSLIFNEFCKWAINRLNYLIEEAVKGNWIEPDVRHLLNYRMKAIKFYQEKIGKCKYKK